MLIHCKVCGTEVVGRGRLKTYCKPCVSRRRQDGVNKRRHANGVKPKGSTILCAVCNTPTISKGRRNIYCEACSAEKLKARYALWRLRNPEKAATSSRANDQRRNKTDERKAYHRAKKFSQLRRKNPKHRLHHRMSTLVTSGLKAGKQGRTWTLLLGYGVEELSRHLERQFSRGMTWKNMGRWHIDHIVPVTAFDFDSAEDGDFKACWALTNLRPLWAAENIKKHAHRVFLI